MANALKTGLSQWTKGSKTWREDSKNKKQKPCIDATCGRFMGEYMNTCPQCGKAQGIKPKRSKF